MTFARYTPAALLTGLLLAGCGGDGAVRYDVAGTVRVGGQPVPAGRIFFTPDASKQNAGPQGTAEIKDGKFDTKTGKGGPGGPVLVRVEGFDGKATAELPLGGPTFVYEGKADLPRGNATQDFDLKPAEVKKVVNTGPAP